MASRFLAALRTYATRRDFWFLGACCLLPLYVAMAFAGRRTSDTAWDTMSYLLFFLSVNAVPGMMVGMQLKLQFANPRARLLPGFAAPHLLAAGAIVAAVVVLEVGVLASARGASALAVTGFALVVIAAAAWACSAVHAALSWLSAILAAGLVVASVYFARSIEAHLLGGNPIASLAEVCIGLAALAVLGWRLWVLSEEEPGYSRRLPASIWDFTSRAASRDRRQLEAQAIARSPTRGWLYDLGLRLALRWGTASGPLRRLLLHQAAGGFSGLFFAPVQVVFLLYFFWLQRWPEGAHATGSGLALLMVSFFPVLMAMSVLGGVWARRLPYLARESLHPLSRTAFVRSFIGSGACDTAAVAAGHCAGIVVGLALFHPQWPPITLVLPYLAMTVVQYFAMYCVTLWLISFRSYWVLVLGNLLTIPSSAGLVVAAVSASEEFWSPVRIALALATTVAAVAVLHRLTLRRWCRMELD
jgi:hypothetical protein